MLVETIQVMLYFLEDFGRLVEIGGSKEMAVAVHLGDSRPGFGNGLEGRVELPGQGIGIFSGKNGTLLTCTEHICVVGSAL